MKSASTRRHSQTGFRPSLELLETRLTPSTFTVANLNDSGTGSLRQAIMDANSLSGPDVIDFSVAGTIQLTSGALPAIVDQVTIDGTSAPGFAGAPIVEIDNNGFAGLIISTGSGSTLESLSIVNANGPGVTLQGYQVTVVGCYIGLALDGSVAANTGVGVFVDITQPNYGNPSIIGGASAADRNVISGNGAGGIQVGESGQQLLQSVNILGNFIGTDPTGQAAAPNQGNGIAVFTPGYDAIGGTAAGAGNTIAFNSQSGVVIDGSSGEVNYFGTDNAILNNSIFNNGAQGIVLQNNGNGNMPAPQLGYAVKSPGSTPNSVQVQVGGVLNVASLISPGEGTRLACTIQVFATLNGVSAGQGQLFLGSVNVTTNTNGFATFTLRNAAVPAGAGATFTATASTSSENFSFTGSTSEFSSSIGAGTANQAYVASVYQLLLNRIPDPSSAGWVNALDNGVTPATVVLGIEGSTEYLNDQVTAMYNHYLGRNPDAGGAQFWTSFLQAGGTLEEVAAQLTASSEFFVMGDGTNPNFITNLYVDVLGRFPSTGEVAGWETVLDNGASRLFVSETFLISQEYRTNLVQADYTTCLLRPADSGGITAWVDALNAGATDQQVLAQIFGSAEGYQVWS